MTQALCSPESGPRRVIVTKPSDPLPRRFLALRYSCDRERGAQFRLVENRALEVVLQLWSCGRLEARDVCVLLAIVTRSHPGSGKAHIGTFQLADAIGRDRHQVAGSVGRLRRAGLVFRHRDRDGTYFRVRPDLVISGGPTRRLIQRDAFEAELGKVPPPMSRLLEEAQAEAPAAA